MKKFQLCAPSPHRLGFKPPRPANCGLPCDRNSLSCSGQGGGCYRRIPGRSLPCLFGKWWDNSTGQQARVQSSARCPIPCSLARSLAWSLWMRP